MPELPEVEVTRLRLESALVGKAFSQAVLRVAKLRTSIPTELSSVLPGLRLNTINRRGKYLLFDCGAGCLLVHLGMTGFLQLISAAKPPGKHDHVDFIFDDGQLLRFRDPRKFGTVDWITGDPLQHPLLAEIGPEPLTESFNGAYLFEISRNRKAAVKQFVMNSAVVAGVGNIYANESLFRAGIRPERAAGSLDIQECNRLAIVISEVLLGSIKEGCNYPVSEETSAYHPQVFKVYGRGQKTCLDCGSLLDEIRLGNRSTVYCRTCQK